eukprot:gene6381-10388_t
MIDSPLVIPSDQEITLKFKDGNIIISMDLILKKGQTVEEALNSLGKTSVPLHLYSSVLSAIDLLFEDEKQTETENLIDELLNHPVDKTKSVTTNNFAEIFSKVFFSNLEDQQKLMRIEQQLNVVFRGQLNSTKSKIELSSMMKKHKEEYAKFVRDIYSELEQPKTRPNIDTKHLKSSTYPKFLNTRTYDLTIRLPGESYLEVSKYTKDFFNLKNEEYKITLFVCFNSNASDYLTLFDRENDINEVYQRTRNIKQLYLNDLNAFLTDCYPTQENGFISNQQEDSSIKFKWNQFDFEKIIEDLQTISSPELHFDDFSEQISSIEKEFEWMEREPEVGEFFVTKHSNLNWIHLIFHLMISKEEGKEKSIKNALMELFTRCGSFGVSTFSFQLPLLNYHKKKETKEEEIRAQLYDILQSLSMAYVKTRTKNFKNLFLFLPEIESVEKFDIEKVLGDILGPDCITSTNLYKKL